MDNLVPVESTRWRRWFFVGLGIGTGVVVVSTLVVAGTVWYSGRASPARPWNQEAVTATFTNLYLNKDAERLTFTFRYTLENHTGRDWTLPSAEALYKVLADGKGLERDNSLAWDAGPSVPAGQKINVGLKIEYRYTVGTDTGIDEKLNEFTNKRLSEIDGFAALDEMNRYDLRLPKPPDLKRQ